MINLAIDPDTNDIILNKRNLTVASDIEALAQLCESRLLVIEGDYFLDKTLGIPYISQVFVKTSDKSLVDSFFKNMLLETEGVNSIISYSGEYIEATRTYEIKFTVDTDLGEISRNTVLGVF